MEAEVVKYTEGLEFRHREDLEDLAHSLDIGGCTGTELYDQIIDILCLMALADAFGFEYGEFVNW